MMDEDQALTLCIDSLDEIDPNPEYAQEGNPNRGKCYIASIALLKFLGGKDSGYQLYKGNDESEVPHYWVVNRNTGRILDPTRDQYEIMQCDPPYENGHAIGYRGNIRRHEPILNKMNATAAGK